jgi:ATP-dependent protease ClpP protease subunit
MNWKKTSKYMGNVEEEEQCQLPMMCDGGLQMPMPVAMRLIDNKILFYDDITNESILELNRVLMELDIRLQNTRNILGDCFDPTIYLRIKSNGGDLFAVLSTVDLIPTLKSKVHTHVDGYVASAGTFISLLGERRTMGKHAFLLIHQLSSGVIGKFSEMEDEMENCTNIMKLIKAFYKEHTKIPMKRLDELLKKDLNLSAEECLQYGIIDAIV